MFLPGLIQFRLCSLTDNQLAEAVSVALNKMYTSPVSIPPRNIPARPNEDFDLLVGELLVRYLEKIELLNQIKEVDIDHKAKTGSFLLPKKISKRIVKLLTY